MRRKSSIVIRFYRLRIARPSGKYCHCVTRRLVPHRPHRFPLYGEIVPMLREPFEFTLEICVCGLSRSNFALGRSCIVFISFAHRTHSPDRASQNQLANASLGRGIDGAILSGTTPRDRRQIARRNAQVAPSFARSEIRRPAAFPSELGAGVYGRRSHDKQRWRPLQPCRHSQARRCPLRRLD
jgi:hypothetical protein